MQSTFEVETAIGLLSYYFLIDPFPLLFDSLALVSIAYTESLIGFMTAHQGVAFRKDKHAHRVPGIANINLIIMNDGSDSAGAYTLDFSIS